MYYDEEINELYSEVIQSVNASPQETKSTPHIIVINGDSPHIQTQIVRQLQSLLPRPFTHISVLQKLMLESSPHESLPESLAKIHSHIIERAANGDNLIISHNSMFEQEQQHLYSAIKKFAPYWVHLHNKQHSTINSDLIVNIESVSISQATFMIYNSLLEHC